MSRPVPSRMELLQTLRSRFADDPDPRLTITEIAVLVQFHRRTLQRYVDEGLIPVERIGPKARVFIRWAQLTTLFREDTRRIKRDLDSLASRDTLTEAPLSAQG